MQILPPQNWFCPRCGVSNPSVAMYCGQCQADNPYARTAVAQPAPQQVFYVINHAPPKSRAAYVVLGLFLGGLGIHNFYAGHIGRGVAQLVLMLFTGWMCFPIFIIGFWVIIELIVTDTDGSGRKMV